MAVLRQTLCNRLSSCQHFYWEESLDWTLRWAEIMKPSCGGGGQLEMHASREAGQTYPSGGRQWRGVQTGLQSKHPEYKVLVVAQADGTWHSAVP